MPDCKYCGDSFEDEQSYLRHLESEHEGELSNLDKRRIGGHEDEEGGFSTGAVILGVTIIGAFAVVAVLVTSMEGVGGGDEPTSQDTVHQHGTIQIVLEGSQLDLNQEQYLENDPNFHFHGGDRTDSGAFIWHVHARGVTVKYALATLGFEVNDDGTQLTVGDREYDADDPDTEINIQVNGEAVEPGEYELSGVGPENEAAAGEGDDLVVEVRTDN